MHARRRRALGIVSEPSRWRRDGRNEEGTDSVAGITKYQFLDLGGGAYETVARDQHNEAHVILSDEMAHMYLAEDFISDMPVSVSEVRSAVYPMVADFDITDTVGYDIDKGIEIGRGIFLAALRMCLPRFERWKDKPVFTIGMSASIDSDGTMRARHKKIDLWPCATCHKPTERVTVVGDDGLGIDTRSCESCGWAWRVSDCSNVRRCNRLQACIEVRCDAVVEVQLRSIHEHPDARLFRVTGIPGAPGRAVKMFIGSDELLRETTPVQTRVNGVWSTAGPAYVSGVHTDHRDSTQSYVVVDACGKQIKGATDGKWRRVDLRGIPFSLLHVSDWELVGYTWDTDLVLMTGTSVPDAGHELVVEADRGGDATYLAVTHVEAVTGYPMTLASRDGKPCAVVGVDAVTKDRKARVVSRSQMRHSAVVGEHVNVMIDGSWVECQLTACDETDYCVVLDVEPTFYVLLSVQTNGLGDEAFSDHATWSVVPVTVGGDTPYDPDVDAFEMCVGDVLRPTPSDIGDMSWVVTAVVGTLCVAVAPRGPHRLVSTPLKATHSASGVAVDVTAVPDPRSATTLCVSDCVVPGVVTRCRGAAQVVRPVARHTAQGDWVVAAGAPAKQCPSHTTRYKTGLHARVLNNVPLSRVCLAHGVSATSGTPVMQGGGVCGYVWGDHVAACVVCKTSEDDVVEFLQQYAQSTSEVPSCTVAIEEYEQLEEPRPRTVGALVTHLGRTDVSGCTSLARMFVPRWGSKECAAARCWCHRAKNSRGVCVDVRRDPLEIQMHVPWRRPLTGAKWPVPTKIRSTHRSLPLRCAAATIGGVDVMIAEVDPPVLTRGPAFTEVEARQIHDCMVCKAISSDILGAKTPDWWADAIDEAVHKGSGFRPYGAVKLVRCAACHGDREVAKRCVGGKYCNGSGKIADTRTYKVTAVVRGDGSLDESFIKLLHPHLSSDESERLIVATRVLRYTSVRCPVGTRPYTPFRMPADVPRRVLERGARVDVHAREHMDPLEPTMLSAREATYDSSEWKEDHAGRLTKKKKTKSSGDYTNVLFGRNAMSHHELRGKYMCRGLQRIINANKHWKDARISKITKPYARREMYVVNVAGRGVRWCLCKNGRHKTSVIFFVVTQYGIRQKCHSKKGKCRDAAGTDPRAMPFPTAVAYQIFGKGDPGFRRTLSTAKNSTEIMTLRSRSLLHDMVDLIQRNMAASGQPIDDAAVIIDRVRKYKHIGDTNPGKTSPKRRKTRLVAEPLPRRRRLLRIKRDEDVLRDLRIKFNAKRIGSGMDPYD